MSVEASSAGRTPYMPVTCCAVGLLVAFFLPWIGALGQNASGFDIARLGSYATWLWLIPVLATVTIMVSLAGINNRGFADITALLILGAAGYAVFAFGSADIPGFVGALFKEGFLRIAMIGLWTTLGLSVAILLLGAVSDPAPPVSSDAEDIRVSETSDRTNITPTLTSGYMRCPSCDVPAKAAARFCGACGAVMSPRTARLTSQIDSYPFTPFPSLDPQPPASYSAPPTHALFIEPLASSLPKAAAPMSLPKTRMPVLFAFACAGVVLVVLGFGWYQRLQQSEQRMQATQERMAANEAAVAALASDARTREAEGAVRRARDEAAAREVAALVASTTLPADPASQVTQANGIDAPNIRVGDQYTYETIDLIEPKLSNVALREVIGFEQGEFLLKFVNQKSGYTRLNRFTPTWSFAGAKVGPNESTSFSPPLQYFRFPLRSGESWTAQSLETNSKTGVERNHTLTGRVEGVERISVPAGTFDAIKVVLETRTSDGTKDITGTDVSWYVASVKRPVKSELQSFESDTGKRGHRIVQLLDFRVN